MPLTKNQIKSLTPGKVYKIAHERKGHFVALFKKFDDEAFRIGDLDDDVYLHVVYDVREGTDQRHMTKGNKFDIRESNLKPSLVISMTETKEQEWLRKVAKIEKPKSGVAKILSNLGKKKE